MIIKNVVASWCLKNLMEFLYLELESEITERLKRIVFIRVCVEFHQYSCVHSGSLDFSHLQKTC